MIIQILFDFFFFQNTVDVNLDTASKFGNITANTAITSFVCIKFSRNTNALYNAL